MITSKNTIKDRKQGNVRLTLIELRKGFSTFDEDVASLGTGFLNNQTINAASLWRGSAQSKIENPKSKIHHAPRGFTLIELLTVIAIIGILAAILIPTVGKVRETARKSTCVSRLKNLGSAFQLYIHDNKGQFPPVQDLSDWRWPIYLAPYIGPYTLKYTASGGVNVDGPNELYAMPVLRDPLFEVQNTGTGVFGINSKLEIKNKNAKAYRFDQISAPSTFPLLSTVDKNHGGLRITTGGPAAEATKYGYTKPTEAHGPSPNYGRMAIFLFADGHAAARDVCNENAWPWNVTDAFDLK